MQGVGAPILCMEENPCITYHWPSVHSVPLSPWVCIHGFSQLQILYYCSLCSEKYLQVSGPMQLKPVLFMGQMYILVKGIYLTHSVIITLKEYLFTQIYIYTQGVIQKE